MLHGLMRTIIVRGFNIPLTGLDRSREKVNIETIDLNYTREQMDLTDTYRTFYPTAEYTLYSSINSMQFPSKYHYHSSQN